MSYAPAPSVPSLESVQTVMEALARQEEPREELIFNPVTGELEVLGKVEAASQSIKPVMTKIAQDGFFLSD